MNSDEEEEEFNDEDTTDYDDGSDTTDEDSSSISSQDEYSPQPIHFRECLRLLDAALTSSNPLLLPQWCHSQHIGPLADPMLFIHGHNQYLSLPLNKQNAKKLIRYGQPFEMKIDIVDGIEFSPTAYEIPTHSFSILNPEWTNKVERYLKTECVGQILQLNPNEIELKVSNLILLKSCQFPRQFLWSKNSNNSSIGKLIVSLPSLYTGGKETIKYYKEKHIYDLADKSLRKSYSYTIVPIDQQCKYEIDYISDGYKLILVYDIIPLTSTVYYNVHINESLLIRLSKIFDKWLNGLEHDYHGYSSKIIIPFSDTFQLNSSNLLLHGIDRIMGTILRRTIEEYYSDRLLLYQGIIQPNRTNDGTIHACRLLTNMNLMITREEKDLLFDHIDLCLGNCNETYSGNIFLRKSRTEQGNLISVEQFSVSIWCLVPISHKYDLLIDNIPNVLTHLENNVISHHEKFFLINWLLTTPKKIQFNTKILLHQLIRLSFNNRLTYDIILILRQLFQHKKFLEQFFPMHTKQEYDDIIYLLNYSKDPKIQLYIHEIFRSVLKRRLRDTDRIKDAIKFIGILYTHNIDSSFLLVLIHELLLNIFQTTNPLPSITDLTNLLSLLSLNVEYYETSCEFLSKQIIQQIKLTITTTTSISTITNLLRAVLIPTLIQIYKNFLKTNQTTGKRKRDMEKNFPSWFLSLYQICLSLLNSYCNSKPTIPMYENLLKNFDKNCCSICHDLVLFLQNSDCLEKTFLIAKDQILHFDKIMKKFHPLILLTKSITSDHSSHQINVIKMSIYDEEISRENHLLRSLLLSNNLFQEQPDTTHNSKRFKASI